MGLTRSRGLLLVGMLTVPRVCTGAPVSEGFVVLLLANVLQISPSFLLWQGRLGFVAPAGFKKATFS